MAEIAGLKLIVPTSVAGSGVSVSASGKVTFTAAASVSVNGCFTSTYDNYLVVCRGVTSNFRSIRNRLRASGSDATGTNYAEQKLGADGTVIGATRLTSQDRASCADFESTDMNGFHLYVYGPALAQPTAQRTVTVSSRFSAQIVDFACTHSLSTAYDGITFFPVSPESMTGSLTIYGLAN